VGCALYIYVSFEPPPKMNFRWLPVSEFPGTCLYEPIGSQMARSLLLVRVTWAEMHGGAAR
jgi:hypothetical protein